MKAIVCTKYEPQVGLKLIHAVRSLETAQKCPCIARLPFAVLLKNLIRNIISC